MLFAISLLSFHFALSGGLASQETPTVVAGFQESSSIPASAAADTPAANVVPTISAPALKAVRAPEFSVIRSATPKPAFSAFESVRSEPLRDIDDAGKRKTWYGLIVAGHSGAALDAWSTRRALSGNYGIEGDPLMRPFAHSNVLYFVTQVTPTVLDYVGGRAMSSQHPWVRRFWWIPQTAGAALSFSAGVHNIRVVP